MTLEGIKLWTANEYHCLQEKDPDDEIFAWIGEHEAHPEFAAWIKTIPAGDEVTFTIKNDHYLFIHKDSSFDFTLCHHLASKGEGLYLLLEAYQHDCSEFVLIKEVWDRDKFNEWLRYYSDGDTVYPTTCPKCGCLAECGRDHYEKRKKRERPWDRVRCTNFHCSHIQTTQRFLEKIRSENREKLHSSIDSDLEYAAREYGYNASGAVSYSMFDPETAKCPDYSPTKTDICRECGETEKILVGEIETGKAIVRYLVCKKCLGGRTTRLEYLKTLSGQAVEDFIPVKALPTD